MDSISEWVIIGGVVVALLLLSFHIEQLKQEVAELKEGLASTIEIVASWQQPQGPNIRHLIHLAQANKRKIAELSKSKKKLSSRLSRFEPLE